MRNYKRDLLTILLAAYGVGFIAEAAYAGVAFIGDGDKIGFSAAKKLLPTIFTCPDGQVWYQGKCEKKCDQSTFPLAETPDQVKGTFDSCTDAWGTYYAYKSCHNGWDLIEGDCKETDCTGFPYTSQPESIAGTVTSCKSGTKMFYKYLSCNEGWDFSNGKCTVHTCSSTTYPYNSKPSSDAGTVISCKTGVAIQYGYSDCRTGWDKSNGYCNIHVCDSNAFPFTSQPSNSIGTVVSCKTGNDVKYGYSACADDYDLINGQCEAQCTLTATSLPANCAYTTQSCSKNGTTYYSTTCSSCNNGYSFNNGVCIENTCDGYNSTSSNIFGCKKRDACEKPSGWVYKCTACNLGYTFSNGSCTANSCSGYYSSSSSIANCEYASFCPKGNDTVYRCSQCNFWYKLVNNTCVEGGMGNCAIGSIYYSDGTCGAYTTEKTAIGVVVHYHAVMSLEEASKTWNDGGMSNDIPDLEDPSGVYYARKDKDGQNHTDIIAAYAKALGQTHEAARYCREMTTGGKLWYLPAIGEMNFMYEKFTTINSALSQVGGTLLDKSEYWSSTQAGISSAWVQELNKSSTPYTRGKSKALRTRCFFAY